MNIFTKSIVIASTMLISFSAGAGSQSIDGKLCVFPDHITIVNDTAKQAMVVFSLIDACLPLKPNKIVTINAEQWNGIFQICVGDQWYTITYALPVPGVSINEIFVEKTINLSSILASNTHIE